MKTKIKEYSKILIPTLIMGILLGWLFFGRTSKEHDEAVHQHEEVDKQTEWTCSMHPQVRSDKPGLCPICAMDLVPVSSMEDGENVPSEAIQMSESAMKLADVQTAVVKKGIPQKTIQLLGKIQPDERNIAEITSRFDGRIEKLHVNFTGQKVQKGQVLASIYSPELVTAQKELLEATQLKETNPNFYDAVRNKLKLWDLTGWQIDQIEEKGEPQYYFSVLSPISGTVTWRHVSTGDYIKEGSLLFEVVSLDQLWIMFDAYESDLQWIQEGAQIDFTVQSLPGKKFTKKISYIDPFIDPTTRVAKVRVEINNKNDMFKPEMFVNGVLKSQSTVETDQLLIPKSSILWTGKRAVVYIKNNEYEKPTFFYKEITLGPEAGKYYVVAEGLEEGDIIATNGVFQIDAAAQLAGKSSMMNPSGGKTSTGHDHGDGSMDTGASSSQHDNHDNQNKEQHLEVNKKFKSQLNIVYEKYLELTDAFVESDPGKVKEEATEVKKALDQVDMGLLKGNAHDRWMKQSDELKKTITPIIQHDDISQQREEFAKFNKIFYQSIKTFGLEDKTAFYQYCPMANDDKGAYWFSDKKEINNPYFGESMLKCGEVKEIIKE